MASSPVTKTEISFVKCRKHFNDANDSSGSGRATTSHDGIIALDKTWFALQETHGTWAAS